MQPLINDCLYMIYQITILVYSVPQMRVQQPTADGNLYTYHLALSAHAHETISVGRTVAQFGGIAKNGNDAPLEMPIRVFSSRWFSLLMKPSGQEMIISPWRAFSWRASTERLAQ